MLRKSGDGSDCVGRWRPWTACRSGIQPVGEVVGVGARPPGGRCQDRKRLFNIFRDLFPDTFFLLVCSDGSSEF
jgi:hypothetical protein